MEEASRQAHVKELLDDLRALEQMIAEDRFVTGRRIGAEQEMFLVDASSSEPAPVSAEVLEGAGDPRLTSELALFNLEANASPVSLGGDCLRALHAELEGLLEAVREAAAARGADVVLAGILPTLRKSDLGADNMTPKPRYRALAEATRRMRGGSFRVYIRGIDELETSHDNVMLESCNTSFQIHYQVHPTEFAHLYNLAQVITAPVLAAAGNSPLLFGRRLWQETRIALFQGSVDARNEAQQTRPPRVSFGEGWVEGSVLEVFREQIARFRVLLPAQSGEDPFAVLRAGEAPRLAALAIHNGTVYRWNRACYGVLDGVPHLRIENRALPAGPTVADEIANAALFFGLMFELGETLGPVSQRMEFSQAKENFYSAARNGLRAHFDWIDGGTYPARALLLETLLPAARRGLDRAGVDPDDAARYLGIVEERVRSERTGARWLLESVAQMGTGATSDLRAAALTAAMRANQRSGAPVHTWELAALPEDLDWRAAYRTVGQFMSTDLFTVAPDELVDLAASVMDWRHIQHVPVEDDEGRLVGIVSYRTLLRLVAQGKAHEAVTVGSIMKKDPVSVSPETRTLDAMRLMREHRVGSLPVVEDGKLVGIITQSDLIAVSARLLEDSLRE